MAPQPRPPLPGVSAETRPSRTCPGPLPPSPLHSSRPGLTRPLPDISSEMLPWRQHLCTLSPQPRCPCWGLSPGPTDLPLLAQAPEDLGLPVPRALRAHRPTQGSFWAAGQGARQLQRQPPSPPAAACGSCSQRGPDTAAMSCAISSGILSLASFPESQPSPAAAPRCGGNSPPGTQAARQPHLAGAAPAQRPCLRGAQGSSRWASPAAPAPMGSPWHPRGHGSHAGSSSIGKASTCLQCPARSAGPRKARQISPGQPPPRHNSGIKKRWAARSGLPTETRPARSTALLSARPAPRHSATARLSRRRLGSQACEHPC